MDLTQIFCQDCRVLRLKNFDENLILAEFFSCCPIGDRYSKLDINKDPFLQDSGPVNSVAVKNHGPKVNFCGYNAVDFPLHCSIG